MAHILPDRDLFAWCHHGTPLGHNCQWCPTVTPAQQPDRGWLCVGCQRVWNPAVLACHHCPEPAAVRGCDPGPIEIEGCP